MQHLRGRFPMTLSVPVLFSAKYKRVNCNLRGHRFISSKEGIYGPKLGKYPNKVTHHGIVFWFFNPRPCSSAVSAYTHPLRVNVNPIFGKCDCCLLAI